MSISFPNLRSREAFSGLSEERLGIICRLLRSCVEYLLKFSLPTNFFRALVVPKSIQPLLFGGGLDKALAQWSTLVIEGPL